MGTNESRHTIYRYGRQLCCLLFAVLFAVFWAGPVRCEDASFPLNASGNRNISPAVDPVEAAAGYSAVLYDSRNGLPTSEVNAIAQTSDGFLWIGGYAGLIRYDGNSFERLDSAASVTNVRCLFADSQDRLWAGSNDAGVFLMEKGGARNWRKADGLESDSIRAIAEDPHGNIYAAGVSGIVMIDTDMQLSVLEDERIVGQTITGLRLGSDGLIYGVSNAGDLFTLEEGRLVSFISGTDYSFKDIRTVLPDPERPGYLYVGTESEVCYGSLEQDFDSWDRWEVSPLVDVECLECIDGRVWICARTGMGYLDKENLNLLRNVPMDNSFCHVMTGSDGNLWIASSRQGLMKIVPNPFADLSEQYKLPADVVNSTCMAGGQLFIGTEDGLIVIEDGKRAETLPVTKAVTASGAVIETSDLLEFLDGIRIRSIIRDSRGRLWISTAFTRGLIRYDKGEITQFTTEDGILSEQVRVVSECEDGSVLVATNRGINVIEGDRVVKRYGQEEGIAVRLILTLTEGFHHELIAGSDGGGIYIIGEDGIKRIGEEDGLPSEVVLRIRRSRTRDIYWIVTGNALAYMTPDYQVKVVRIFPYTNNYDLYENSAGDLWVLGSSGIYVVSAEELMSEDSSEYVFLGIPNGLPCVPTANAYSELTGAGDLYISGNEGVIRVNVNHTVENKGERKTALPYVDCDGRRYYPDSDGTFTVPGSARKLTIYPYVLDFSLSDPQISYRLDGFDLSDTTVNRGKLVPVDYTNLRIGTYHFVMTVKEPISHSEQTVSFRIVKGKKMSASTAGTLIMICASLILLAGILLQTFPYRKGFSGQLQDRLFFGMILANAALAAGELLSYLLEYINLLLIREFMIAANSAFYAALVLFPYLLFVYLDYSADADKIRVRKTMLLYGIPFFLAFAVVLINLKTGWIFKISDGNAFKSGPYGEWVFWLAIFYFLISLIRMYQLNKRLAALCALLIVTRMAWELWFQNISSTSFIYTMILMCVRLYMMNRPLYEEAI